MVCVCGVCVCVCVCVCVQLLWFRDHLEAQSCSLANRAGECWNVREICFSHARSIEESQKGPCEQGLPSTARFLQVFASDHFRTSFSGQLCGISGGDQTTARCQDFFSCPIVPTQQSLTGTLSGNHELSSALAVSQPMSALHHHSEDMQLVSLGDTSVPRNLFPPLLVYSGGLL